MKRVVALILSLFTIILLTASVFAAGFSGGVNGDGSFDGGGFSGGSRLSGSFGTTSPQTSTLSTMLSYEALNNLTANINLGISLGEIEILDGAIQSVTVTERADWNAYVITGVANGNTYVIVNGSGGRYYSPINEGYTISAIAGADGYCITDRPAGTVGNGYLGDLQVPSENMTTIHSVLSGLDSPASFYSVLRIVDGEYRYYMMCTYPNRSVYYVCNRAGQLYYTVKEAADTGGDGDGSTFDDTEVITAINSVYDALDIGFYDVCNWLEAIQKNISSLNNDVLLMSQNVVNGFADLAVVGGRIEGTLSTIVLDFDGFRSDFAYYFKGLTKPYGEEITVELQGDDNLLEWSNGDYVKDIQVEGSQSSRLYISYLGSENELGGTPDVSLANSSDGYYLDAESNGDGFYNYIQCVAPDNADKVVHTNFVKNGDLRSPLNSNGKLVYSTKGKTIDGWTMWGDNGAITVEDGYVNYSVDSYDGYRNFYYPLDIDYELNATYTVSLLARVNSCTGTVRCRAANGAYGLTGFDGHSILLAPYSGGGLVLLTTTFTNTTQLYDNARLEFNVNPNASIDIDIYAVKVERSSSQSLAFLGYDGSYYLFTDVYTPPNPKIMIDNELFELSTSLSFCGNEHDKIYYNAYEGKWMVYRYLGDSSSYLPLYDQKIMNRTVGNDYGGVASILVRDLTPTGLVKHLYDGKNHIDIDSPTVVTVTYYHERTWFDVMYASLDKLYTRLDSMDSREYVDEVEEKLDVITSTLTTQNGYVDEVESKLDSLVSPITQMAETFNLWFGIPEDMTEENMPLYPSLLITLNEGIWNVNDNVFSGFNSLHSYVDNIETSLADMHSRMTSHFTSVEYFHEQLLVGLSEALAVNYETPYLLLICQNLYDIRQAVFGIADYDTPPALFADIYDSVDGLETTLSNIYDRLGDIEDAVISADNVIIDITTNNDAFNIFYITKTDGTTESVGDAAKDAAVFVGDILSMFYRLVFSDALDNVDILEDFEGVYSNTEVSVW